MKGIIRTIQAVLTVIWLALLALSVLLYMSGEKDELPGISKWAGFAVTDSSMEPELAPGDLAVISMGEAAQPGDGILYRDSSGRLALTRIIGTSEGQLILKADNQEDSLLTDTGEVLGVCVGYMPGFGEPFSFLCSLAAIIVIAIAGLVLVVLPGFLLRAPAPPKPARPRQPQPEMATRPAPERTRRASSERPRQPMPEQTRLPAPERAQRLAVQHPAAQRPAPERPRQPRPPRKGGYTPRH